MAFFLKGLGDPVQRINEILPRFDASIFNFITQTNPGICWWETNRFNATVADRGVNVGAGMAFCHGYFGTSDSTHRINFTPPASGTQFARIFAEVNLSTNPHRFRIAATNQSTSSSIGLTQNNLSTNPKQGGYAKVIGTHRLTLAEARNYLGVDVGEQDGLVSVLLSTATHLVEKVLRVKITKRNPPVVKTAVLFALWQLYFHRDNKDFDVASLEVTLATMLSDIRKGGF